MNIDISYNPAAANELCYIMGKFGSDKGHSTNNGWHNYTTYYYPLFVPVRNESLKIFELGIGTNNTSIPSNMGRNGKPGASLRGWKEFFPNSLVYGADIDTAILFSEDRIATFFCNQLSSSIIETMWDSPDLSGEFDIIIDDGLHTNQAAICFFENSIHKLKKGGVYIIEDILNSSLDEMRNQINKWKVIYTDLNFKLLSIVSRRNHRDNNLLVIQKC